MTKYRKPDYWVIYTPKLENGKYGKSTIASYEGLKSKIGMKNANKVFIAAITQTADSKTIKFRKYGKCEIRLK